MATSTTEPSSRSTTARFRPDVLETVEGRVTTILPPNSSTTRADAETYGVDVETHVVRSHRGFGSLRLCKARQSAASPVVHEGSRGVATVDDAEYREELRIEGHRRSIRSVCIQQLASAIEGRGVHPGSNAAGYRSPFGLAPGTRG